MEKSLYMTLIAIAISLVAAGCGKQQSSWYMEKEMIQKHSQYILRSQMYAYLNWESTPEASAAALNLIRYAFSNESSRDTANMKNGQQVNYDEIDRRGQE